MEKRKDAQKTMFSLNSEEGKLLTSQADILEEVKNYFGKLYKPQDPFLKQNTNLQLSNLQLNFNPKLSNLQQSFNPNTSNLRQDFNPVISNLQNNFNPTKSKSNLQHLNPENKKDSETENKERNQNKMIEKLSKTISTENKLKCEKDIETKDIEQAIKSFQNNKSPRNDGLTVEFYKAFFDILQNDLKQLYEEISGKRKIPDSMRQAVITCIYKKGNMQDITNWRPISLLNYDYQI